MSKMNNVFMKIYCKGGWEVEGVVTSEGEDRFVLKGDSTFIVYKDSISIIELNSKKKEEEKKKLKKDFSLPEQVKEDFPQNALNYGEYSSSLPKTMLQNYNEKNNTETDLSISFGGSRDTSGRIEFGVKDESENKKDNS